LLLKNAGFCIRMRSATLNDRQNSMRNCSIEWLIAAFVLALNSLVE
jgi:hypothetical protein